MQVTETNESFAEGPGRRSGLVLQLESIEKHYGDVVAVHSLDLAVQSGEFLTILGPSGCGKTTMLRLIAGFIIPTAGRIVLNGRDVVRLSPAERGIGMVFQQYALFPHMTVAGNIEYGLKMRHWSRSDRDARVDEMLDLVGLSGLGHRLPRELSGGQQQRVALARALAFGPSLLLMDEPLGALDRDLRFRMAAEIRRIHLEMHTTVIYVTHDRDEALALADRIALMRGGRLEAVDSPRTLYTRPASAFVASFFGGHNLLPVRIVATGDRIASFEYIDTHSEAAMAGSITEESQAWLAVPTNAIHFGAITTRMLAVDATVHSTSYQGEAVRMTCVADDGTELLASVPIDETGCLAGDRVHLYIDLARAVIVPEIAPPTSCGATDQVGGDDGRD